MIGTLQLALEGLKKKKKTTTAVVRRTKRVTGWSYGGAAASCLNQQRWQRGQWRWQRWQR
jgi:hypothetical protein